jgi:hypothetical protein
MDKLNFTSKTELVSVERIERIERIEIKDDVVTAFFEVVVNGIVKDTFNITRKVSELPKELEEPVQAIADSAAQWKTAAVVAAEAAAEALAKAMLDVPS